MLVLAAASLLKPCRFPLPWTCVHSTSSLLLSLLRGMCPGPLLQSPRSPTSICMSGSSISSLYTITALFLMLAANLHYQYTCSPRQCAVAVPQGCPTYQQTIRKRHSRHRSFRVSYFYSLPDCLDDFQQIVDEHPWNNVEDSVQPCGTPCSISKDVDSSPSSMTALFVHSCHLLQPSHIFPLMPYLNNCLHSLFLHTVSYAFFTSRKKQYVGFPPSF
ncbi:unnamed protein product [Ectocarpus sp. 12 AP-2014]